MSYTRRWLLLSPTSLRLRRVRGLQEVAASEYIAGAAVSSGLVTAL